MFGASGMFKSVFFRGRDLNRNVQRFRGGLVFKDHRLCVSLNSRLESNKEEEEEEDGPGAVPLSRFSDFRERFLSTIMVHILSITMDSNRNLIQKSG